MTPAQFMERVAVDESGCWLWQQSTNKGYGQCWHQKRNRPAHLVAYELFVGPLPEGLVSDHLCRVRRCVNPEHLEFVTNRENILRGVGWTARNARKTHCPQGHPYSEENTYVWRGLRRCRKCITEKHRRIRARRKAKS